MVRSTLMWWTSCSLSLEAARIGGLSWAPGRTAVPPVEGPCLADEATVGDDGVGEVEEGVDDVLVAFIAALEAVEVVVPGVGALDGPALPGLDGRLLALAGHLPAKAASGQLAAGLVRVVPGVQVHPDVTGQRAELAELVQRRGQQPGVVPVRRGEHAVQREAEPVSHARALHALLAAVHRAASRALAAAGRLGDAAVDDDLFQDQ